LRPEPRYSLGRSNIECQADWCEHIDQGVKDELADLSVQEIRNSGLGRI
jgi:hypothetical protein